MPVPTPISEKLPESLAECHALIRELARDVTQYLSRIEFLTRRLFGRSAERLDPAALAFFGAPNFPGAETPAVESVEPAAAPAPKSDAAAAAPSRRNGRRPLPAELPRERVEHDVPDEQKICAECGSDKKRIGEETSEQLEYIPASLRVIEHVRPKYACPHCQGEVVIGEKPPQPIEKGLAGPGLLAQVITSKYCDHLPLHRQEAIFARQGVELTRQTLCDWVMACADVLAPVAKQMRHEILKSYCIHTDDTPVPVQDLGQTHRAYLWVYIGDPDHPYTYYDFTWGRSREGPEAALAGYEGFLQADAFTGYDPLYTSGKIIEVGCMAHARRYFFDAKSTAPVLANEVLLRIGSLYTIEREAKELKLQAGGKLDPEVIRALRQEKAVPKLAALETYLREREGAVLPKSPIGQAIAYALSNWTALTRYAADGRLAIDNNAAERALRAVVIGRKNWLFAGSRRGGKAAATLYSLIASAKQNALDPFAYLRDLLARIPTHPHRQLDDLLPDRWKAQFAKP
jgi:transposase